MINFSQAHKAWAMIIVILIATVGYMIYKWWTRGYIFDSKKKRKRVPKEEDMDEEDPDEVDEVDEMDEVDEPEDSLEDIPHEVPNA